MTCSLSSFPLLQARVRFDLLAPIMFEDWKSFIIACFVKRTLEVAIQECQGCQDSSRSPLLHAHHTGLYKKLTIFFEQIRTELQDNLEKVYNQYQKKFTLDCLDFDYSSYSDEGIEFLKNLNPDSLIYGRYITKENDLKIYGDVQSKPSGKKRKKGIHKSSVGS